ncbi:hypothetical protein IX307_001894 [Bacteroides pyogenes]|nr:hypothetical protein [Bacteroides pyogenes]MBR8720721.1 hypothetical protein [Bacteroides pyogenes]MBR8724228.1 hypothetical protein [Bacteroides pyogenes]MBR8737443.1 hypothetical protein [Bacteroides pyogenes]MBR8753377.1 hypothetical protein [Bacteroides pyogenes]
MTNQELEFMGQFFSIMTDYNPLTGLNSYDYCNVGINYLRAK